MLIASGGAALVVAVLGIALLWWWGTEGGRESSKRQEEAQALLLELEPIGPVEMREVHSEGISATVRVPGGLSVDRLPVPRGYEAWSTKEYEAGEYVTLASTHSESGEQGTGCDVFIRVRIADLPNRDRIVLDIFC